MGHSEGYWSAARMKNDALVDAMFFLPITSCFSHSMLGPVVSYPSSCAEFIVGDLSSYYLSPAHPGPPHPPHVPQSDSSPNPAASRLSFLN